MAFSLPIEVVYNAFYFSFYAGYAPFIMFRPVYFKYIGLSPVFVGLLCGLRFILQSTGTPLLIILAERLRSRKLLFVISYIVLMAKLLIILVVLRPRHQMCVIKYSGDRTMSMQHSFVIHHVLLKRDVFENWNETNEDEAILWGMSVVNNKTLNTTHSPVSSKFQEAIHTTSALQSKISTTISSDKSNNGLQASATPGITEHIIYNDKEELFRIFLCLLVLVLLSDAFDSTMFTLVEESCSVSTDADHYGQAQTCGTVGWGIIVPNIGIIIYYFNQELCGKFIGSFHYVFYFAFAFLTVAFFCGLCLDYPTNTQDILVRKVQGPSSNFQYSMFTFASSYSGFCNGFLLTFTYWFIDNLGGSAMVMGLTTGCRAVVNIIIAVVLVKAIEHIGHQIIVHIGIVCHIIVFVIYFSIKRPLLVLVAEVFHATVHIVITRTCSSFLSMKAPTGSSPKMQGILQGIYWGLGTGCGAILGGYYLEYSGFRMSFIGFSIITSIVCIVFLILHILLYLINPEITMDDIWTVWSAAASNYESEYEGSAEESDDFRVFINMADLREANSDEGNQSKNTKSKTKKRMKTTNTNKDDSGCGNISSFCSNVRTNCTDESASYKFFNFFFYGAVQTFNSYISVYLKSLGLTASHVGLINGSHPLLQIIGAPLAGILGDRFKIKRVLLLVGLVVMTVRTMLYLPVQPEKQVCNIVYVNKTHHKVISSKFIEFHITKRSMRDQFMASTKYVNNKTWGKETTSAKNLLHNSLDSMDYVFNNSNDESDVTKEVRPNTEVDPFLSPPSVVIKKTKDYKLIYVKTEDQDEIERIFIVLLCLALFGEIFEALVSTIADTCCLDYLGEERERFGMFRFWGALGAGITSPISGAIFDHYGQMICGRTVSGYHYLFYIYFAYLCAAFIAATHFRYRYDTSVSTSKNKNIKDALLNLNYGIFLLVTLYMGLCYGFLTSFSFWFLDDLGANAVLLGVASSLRSVAENCVYFVSPFVLVRFGHVNIAGVCLLVFGVTCLLYSFLFNPWFAIPLEVLSTGAYAFSWTTCVSYLNRAAPPGSSTTVQGIVQASFWGLGFGGGSIIGGFSFRVFGERESFRGFSVASFTVFVFFVIIQCILSSAEKKEKGSKYQALSNKEEISQAQSPSSEENN
ncbi:uncharacterized protein LOC114517829 [Dendronephthya gigantea]|uniref:uncharacterized protein LOC114517829 n=1 Tax=Dendronephthya gigantea TaxID=151771 RepID=UPI00106B95B5|nr:uncharacterized protein LOC114517829 [Dendronephthya gigantea]